MTELEQRPLEDRINMLPRQARRIAQLMVEVGYVTRLSAVAEVGCFELAARIIDIERGGITVNRERRTRKNRFGDTVRFIRYTIAR